MLYTYIKNKHNYNTAISSMNVVPSDRAIERIVKNHGFLKIRGSGTKDCQIDLKKKSNKN